MPPMGYGGTGRASWEPGVGPRATYILLPYARQSIHLARLFGGGLF